MNRSRDLDFFFILQGVIRFAREGEYGLSTSKYWYVTEKAAPFETAGFIRCVWSRIEESWMGVLRAIGCAPLKLPHEAEKETRIFSVVFADRMNAIDHRFGHLDVAR